MTYATNNLIVAMAIVVWEIQVSCSKSIMNEGFATAAEAYAKTLALGP